MSAYNNFKFIGKCYGDARKTLTTATQYAQEKKYYTTITLVVKCSSRPKKNNYIPITAYGELSEKASLLCRNGNKVAIEGEIMSKEFLDKDTGVIRVQTVYIAQDIMLIEKPLRQKVSNKVFTELVELASIDEYKPPKKGI